MQIKLKNNLWSNNISKNLILNEKFLNFKRNTVVKQGNIHLQFEMKWYYAWNLKHLRENELRGLKVD